MCRSDCPRSYSRIDLRPLILKVERGTLRNVVQDERLNHRCAVQGGLLESESAELLKAFLLVFVRKRNSERCGVVERGGLENRCGCKVTEGSNPSLSAMSHFRIAER